MTRVQGVLSPLQLKYFQGLPDVLTAQEKLSESRSRVDFTLELPTDIKQSLLDSLGLDLFPVSRVPLRWIRGDTAAHTDRGIAEFENTYLVYLTDGQGEFHIDEDTYPIEAGAGYTFPEGSRHEVLNTNGTSRLLLGPMSETGFPVGASISLDGNGETDTLYFGQDLSGSFYFRINNGAPITLFGAPYYINNTSASPSTNILKVYFETGLVINNIYTYFICNTAGIQFGNTNLSSSGEKTSVFIDTVTDYPGFIQNGSSGGSGNNNIKIYNIIVDGSTSTLANGNGWIGQAWFGRGTTGNAIVNCRSSGTIPQGGGGITGAYTAGNGANVLIRGCSSQGTIGNSAGGIVGESSVGSTGCVLTIDKCFSTGNIGSNAGGICGNSCGINGGTITATACYTLGSIGSGAGGLYGASAGSAGSVSATRCYSTGAIVGGGGLYGANAGTTFGGNPGSAVASNCYTTGNISSGGAGIYASGYGSALATNCYTTGSNSTPTGGIWAGSSSNSVLGSNNYGEANAGSSGWNKTRASSTLQGVPSGGSVGTNWIEIVVGDPFELANYGYTPYTTNVISNDQLVQSFSQTIEAGQISDEALAADASGNAFAILGISGGDADSYATITISAQRGSISTTAATVPGTYTLSVRSIGSYNNTIFLLTIRAASGGNEAGSSSSACCVEESGYKGLSYEWINDYKIGNRLILEVSQNPGLRFDGYSQFLKYKMALGSRKN